MLFKDQLPKLKDKVYLSSIGARVCYNKEDICYLLDLDPRVINDEERSKFLQKLGYQYYHTSVFSHTFDYFVVDNLNDKIVSSIGLFGEYLWDKFKDLYYFDEFTRYLLNNIFTAILSANLFKSVYIPNTNIIGLSLRHFIELSENCDECKEEILKLFKESEFKIPEYTKKYYQDFKNRRIKVLPLYINKKDYDGWCVFGIQEVSRIMTHQLIRHTKLNFSQRSQRYVYEGKEKEIDYRVFKDLFVIPESIRKDLKVYNSYLDLMFQSYKFYVDSKKNSIPKEDARFGLLNASKTSIVISGTYKDIVDFIEKRRIKQAQWEIREVAEEMERILQD